eukprot:gb/GFBE01050572.1/.p1 GENE.gb/GFBE01050572.1/~~gb/GFBE01050572.1/.p1  ORF type:complete len:530 (+),score=98.86 gb/GFBE01050572.1/:1-1590(+)
MGRSRWAAALALSSLAAGHATVVDPGWDLFWESDLRDMDRPISLEVQGQIPSWVHGSLIRNGPALFTSPKRNLTFVFDGCAKLFKFEVQDGSVRFQEKFLRTQYYNLTTGEGSFPKGAYMGPVEPPFPTFKLPENGSDNVNTHSFQLNGDTVGLATTDSAFIGMFDPATLDTVGVLNWTGASVQDKVMLSATHAHYLPGSNREKLVNVVSQLLGVGAHKLIVYQMGTDHQHVPFGSVTVPYVPYIHSFGVTQKHMLLVAYPLSFREVCVLEFRPIIDCLAWLNQDVSIFAFSFNGTADSEPVMTFKAPAHFVLHHVNSFEDDEAFWMDVGAYHDGSSFKAKFPHGNFRVMHNREERNQVPNWGLYRRLRIDRSTGAVEMQDLPMQDVAGITYHFDFPFINPDYEGWKHCFVWANSAYARNSTEYAHWAVVKTDVCTKSKANTLVWFEQDQYPSEPVFVPRPGATAEDDGVLTVQVLDGRRGTGYLLVLDAQNLKELGRSYLPDGWATPYTQHGSWFAPVAAAAENALVV